MDLGALLNKCIADACITLTKERAEPNEPVLAEHLQVYLWRQNTYPPPDCKQRDRWIVVIMFPCDDEVQDAFVYADGEHFWKGWPGPLFWSLLDSRDMPIGADKGIWDALGATW